MAVAAARVHPRVKTRGIAVLDPHVRVTGAPDREAAEEIEALALAQPSPALDYEPRVLTRSRVVIGRKRMEAGRIRSGRDGLPQVLAGAARDPEQEQVEDGQEAELEGY